MAERDQRSSGIRLIPLDGEMVRRRLQSDTFEVERAVDGRPRRLRFGPQFPGEALVFYERFAAATPEGAAVAGSFVVVDVDTAEVIGQVGTLGPATGAEVEIGYGLNAAVHGQGFGTRAVALLVTVLEDDPAVGRLTARCSVDNPASARVLEKNGFAVTGREDGDEGELIAWARPPARRYSVTMISIRPVSRS